MQNTILYVTTNAGKFAEVSSCARKLTSRIVLKQASLDTPEIQSDNQEVIAIDKALKAWQVLRKPLLIDDAGLFIERYYNFPGTLSKYIVRSLDYAGLSLLIKPDERAAFKATMVFVDTDGETTIFHGITEGTVIAPPKTKATGPFPYDQFFIPAGETRSYAQLRADPLGKKELSYREKALQNFIAWYEEKF